MVIYGNIIAQEIKERIKETVNQYRAIGKRVPTLAVILVGDEPASLSYVKGKSKAAAYVGIDFKLIHLSADTQQAVLEKTIIDLNNDPLIDAILLQLPLPQHLNETAALNLISSTKDVDGLTELNAGRLFLGREGFIPCTPLGVMAILATLKLDLKGKRAVVVGRSKLVGLPLARLLTAADATVTLCHSKTEDLRRVCQSADILVVAIGKAKFIDHTYLKDGVTVIDVGINRVDGKLCGDVDFADVVAKCAYITPVPKGVGPMTIAMLLENVLKAYRQNNDH